MMSRVVNDTDLFEQLIAHAIPDVVVNLLTFIGVSLVLFSMNWKLTLLAMLPIPLHHCRCACMPAGCARRLSTGRRNWAN